MIRFAAALLLWLLPMMAQAGTDAVHVVTRGETLMGISRTHYGSADRAADIARANGLKDANRLRVGQRLRLPDLAEAAPRAVPVAPAAAKKPAPKTDALKTELRHAVNAYLDGDYATALERLRHLRTPVLARGSAADQKLLLQHLVFVNVAFDRGSDACDALRGLERVDPEVDPRRDWDPELVSPKIRDAVRACPSS